MVESGMSILTADFGSVHTRVLLIDVVDGEYRIVARRTTLSTKGYPANDVSVGLLRILDDMSRTLHRRFLDNEKMLIVPEDQNRNGVDAFVTTTSAGRPMRAVMVGLMPDMSLASALRAVSSTYVEPVASINLKDDLNEVERLNAILLNRPDLIFVAGGTEGGAAQPLIDILETLQLAINVLPESKRPTVLYAGNVTLVPQVHAMFDELTHVLIADNIRPTLDKERPESALVQLGAAYDIYRDSQSEGFGRISEMSNTGLLPTSQSYALLAEYFAQTRDGNVLIVDMGGNSTTLVAHVNGEITTRIETQMGLGQSAETMLQIIGEDAVENWLPLYPESGEIVAYALNKALRPATLPMNLRDLYFEHAFLRGGLNHLVRDAAGGALTLDDDTDDFFRNISLIVAGGAALTSTGHPAYNMMLIADSLLPTGVTEVKIDSEGLAPALAAITRLRPEASAQLIEGPDFEHLGTLISIEGKPEPDQVVAELEIQSEDGEKLEIDSNNRNPYVKPLDGGRLYVLPIAQSESVIIQVRCKRGFSVNGKRRMRLAMSGGTAGIILDTRGRPIVLGDTPQERAEQMPLWIQEVTDDDLLPIPNEWLVPPESVPFSDPEANERGGRRGLFGRRGQSEAEDEVTLPDDFDLLDGLDDLDDEAAFDPEDDKDREADELDSLRNLL